MRLLPSALIATLLGTTLGFAQNANSNVYGSHSAGGKKARTHSGLSVPHHMAGPDPTVGTGGGKHGVAEELAKAERENVSQSPMAAHTKTPRLASLPKLDLDKSGKKGKGSGINVSGQSHKNKGLTTNSKARRTPSSGGGSRIR